MQRLLRYGNYLMLGAFTLGTLAQLNDPDALAWIALCGAASILCLRQALASPVAGAAALLSAIAILWAVLLLPDVMGKTTAAEIVASLRMQSQAVEELREIIGLLLLASWMLVLWLSNRESPGAAQGSG